MKKNVWKELSATMSRDEHRKAVWGVHLLQTADGKVYGEATDGGQFLPAVPFAYYGVVAYSGLCGLVFRAGKPWVKDSRMLTTSCGRSS